MRVFSAGLQSLLHPWAKVGPLKGPRSRWTGIPRYPEHRHLVEIVISYQNGGDCKSKLPLSVYLVVNEYPYGLMFSLSFL
jgi:hypothetical protein